MWFGSLCRVMVFYLQSTTDVLVYEGKYYRIEIFTLKIHSAELYHKRGLWCFLISGTFPQAPSEVFILWCILLFNPITGFTLSDQSFLMFSLESHFGAPHKKYTSYHPRKTSAFLPHTCRCLAGLPGSACWSLLASITIQGSFSGTQWSPGLMLMDFPPKDANNDCLNSCFNCLKMRQSGILVES